MERRKFLIGAGSAAVGSSALIGSGAFSQARVERSVTVNVASDNNAYLGLKQGDGADNEYANFDEGAFEFQLDDTPGGGTGVNEGGYFVMRDVFEIHNQGTQEVQVWADDVPEGFSLGSDLTYYDEDGNEEGSGSRDVSLERDVIADAAPDPAEEWSDPRVRVPEGEALLEGYLIVNDVDEEINGELTIHARTQDEY